MTITIFDKNACALTLGKSHIPYGETSEYHAFCLHQSIRLEVYAGIETAHNIACFIEKHGEIAGKLLNHFGGDLGDAQIAIEENYSGCYRSLADYAQEVAKEIGDIPPRIESYVDYECLGRDMELGEDV